MSVKVAAGRHRKGASVDDAKSAEIVRALDVTGNVEQQGSAWFLSRICNLSTTTREWAATCRVSTLDLAPTILQPNPAASVGHGALTPCPRQIARMQVRT